MAINMSIYFTTNTVVNSELVYLLLDLNVELLFKEKHIFKNLELIKKIKISFNCILKNHVDVDSRSRQTSQIDHTFDQSTIINLYLRFLKPFIIDDTSTLL